MPESNWGYPYADVDAAAYYSTPVYWARMNDLVTGYSDTQFGPDDAITREQMAAILYRYMENLELDTDTDFIPDKYYDFPDYIAVSRYAANAMSWCVNNGIINGSNGKLNPQGTATRAEVATMLMNAESILNKSDTKPDREPVPPTPEDNTGSENTDDNLTVTDEISQRPTGQSAVDEYGGYWDYDLSNATFDAINDLREENNLDRLSYSLQVQEWADIRSKELVGAYRDNLYDAHFRPDGTPFVTVGKGCNTENALGNIISASAQSNANIWYASEGHRDNILNTRSITSAVSIYVLGERTYAIQLFNILTIEELNQL